MFTGIVEITGTVLKLEFMDSSESGGNGVSLTIKDAKEILKDCHLGDSIAINGTCLTVTEFDEDSFKVGIAPETLEKTNLGLLKVDEKVNLERAVAIGFRFGGHFVQGHVDTTAEIVSITPDQNSIWYRFRVADPSLMKYIIPKGFIAIDGTSLTVCDVDDVESTFTVMLIAYTQTHVIMTSKSVGSLVNIEVDMLGKYVDKIVGSTIFDDRSGTGTSRLEQMIETVIEKKVKELKPNDNRSSSE